MHPLLEQEPGILVVANRTVEKAKSLAAKFATSSAVSASSFYALAGQSFDLVLNATAASLAGEVPPLPEGVFAPGGVAYDMMYGKGDTPFMGYARSRGAAVCTDGLGMLVEQAAEAFYVWRGIRPSTEKVLQQLRDLA
jgi:shikimate dehydrogenase